MTTSTWPKLAVLVAALTLFGASCTINLGGGVDGGVFRSDDHGQTWKQVNRIQTSGKQALTLNDVSGRILTFDPQDSGHLYLGTLANGIWTSPNHGDTWVATSLRSGAYGCLAFDPINPEVLYTASGSLIMKSTDSGVHWTSMYTEPQPNNAVNCVATNPVRNQEVYATTTGGKILRSDDYGKTWTLVATLTTPIDPRAVIVSDDGSTITIFDRSAGIHRSTTRGQQWIDLTPNLLNFTGGTDIRQVTIQGSAWYLATAYGVLKSLDQGNTWKSLPVLVNNGSVPVQSVAVNPRNSQDIFITTNQQLHHSTDGGATWSVITLPTGRLPELLTFDPGNPDRLYFATFKIKK